MKETRFVVENKQNTRWHALTAGGYLLYISGMRLFFLNNFEKQVTALKLKTNLLL